MVVLLFARVFDVVHLRGDFHHFDLLQSGVEVLDFLAGIVDAIPLELSTAERLALGYCLVQIGAGGIDFLGEQERGMDPRAGQFAGVIVGGDVHAVVLGDHLDTAFAVLHGH
ncbi:hypothetical protein D3C84_931760 [compost metagenome]